MIHWDEMASPGGFNEGHRVPTDAFLRRAVYLRVVNALLARHGSGVRVVARRHHFRNLFGFAPVPAGEWRREAAYDDSHPPTAGVAVDDGYRAAVTEAKGMGLDEYVRITQIICPESWAVVSTPGEPTPPVLAPPPPRPPEASSVYMVCDARGHIIRHVTSLEGAAEWLQATYCGKGYVVHPAEVSGMGCWRVLARVPGTSGEYLYVYRRDLF